MEGVNIKERKEKEELELRKEEARREETRKKRDKTFSVITGISVFIFVFALYVFLMGSLSNNQGSKEELENQGIFLYTLNAVNPLNALTDSFLFNNFFSKNNLIIIILSAAVIIVLLLVIFIYIKIWKIKKIKIQAEKPEKVEERPEESQEFNDYNKKVLDLIKEGNSFMDKSDFFNARMTYHKIKGWYDHHSDKNRKIYYEIIKFYRRIANQG